MQRLNEQTQHSQICWAELLAFVCFFSFPLSLKDDLPPNRCFESHRLLYFLPFQRLWVKCKASAAVPSARNCPCLCHCYFLAQRWKMLRERQSGALNLWERLGFALVGDTASVRSCRSFVPVTALPAVSTPPRSWLGFVWQPALIAPWGILGGREPSPWWSEHRTSAKQSIVTGARWGERNKMSQQQVFFFFLLFLPLMPIGVCLAFDSSVLASAKRVVCDIC